MFSRLRWPVTRAMIEIERWRLAAMPVVAGIAAIAGIVALVTAQVAPEGVVAGASLWTLLVCAGLFILGQVIWLFVPALWWGARLVWAARRRPGGLVLLVALSLAWLALFLWVMPLLHRGDMLYGRLLLVGFTWVMLVIAYQLIVLRMGRL